MKDIQIIDNGTVFNYRVSGAVIKNNKIMLNRMKNDDFWTFVGGKVAFAESSEKAVIREYLEETGATVEVERAMKDNSDGIYKWFDLTELDKIKIQPECSQQIISNLDSKGMQHIINES